MYHHQRKLPLIIKKSNDLVRTQLSVENNALANKIFAALIRHVDEKSFPVVSFSASELIDEKAKGGGEYRKLKKAAEVLMKARLDSVIVDETGKETGFRMVNVFSSCIYDKGLIAAEFNAKLKPHLLGLKNYFTELNYFDLIELSSFYSQRIYELLKSWEKPNGLVPISLDALYDLISYPKDLRNNFASVRRYALEQAEKEINKKTELRFRWEPIKNGRKVIAVRFIIGEQGEETDKKHQIKTKVKEKQKAWEDHSRRQPYLEAARRCRLDHGTKPGDVCKLARPRSKKCQLCAKTSGIVFCSRGGLFDS